MHTARRSPRLCRRRRKNHCRATPEREGVASRAIHALLDAVHVDEAARAHEIMVLRNGELIAEANWSPYDSRLPASALFAEQEHHRNRRRHAGGWGLLDIDERLCDIFFDKAPESETHPAQKMTVPDAAQHEHGDLL